MLAPLTAAAAIFAAWQIAAISINESLLLPTPMQTVKELFFTLSQTYFYRALLSTFVRGAVGFLLSVVLAVTVAAIGFVFRPFRLFFRTVVAILRAVPTMSVILFMLLWSNTSLTPILVSTLVIFPILYSALTAAYDGIDPQLTEYARLTSLSRTAKLRRIYLPLCVPSFLETCASTASLNIKLLIAAEVLAQTRRSLGLLMQMAQVSFQTGRLLALTLAVIVLAALLEGLFLLLRKIAVKAMFG